MSVDMTQAPQSTQPLDPNAEFARMFAPVERTAPAVKLRRVLRSRFRLRALSPEKSYLHTAGAYDAMTAAMLTELGFEAVYANGWQWAAARDLYPRTPHMMAELVRELARGIEGQRDRRFYDSGGEVLESPPIFADIEAGCGGPAQAVALTRELIRAGAAGVCLDEREDWLETLVAVKAAARAAENELVVIVRTGAVERALMAAALGADVVCPEFAGTDLDAPRRFAATVLERFPDQILGFDFSPSLPWGEAKKRGALPTNAEFGEMGYALQFSTLFAFRTAGMALESWLRGYRRRGVEALADLQLVEVGSLDGEPSTRRHLRFAGTGRRLALERAAKAAARRLRPG